MPNKLIKVEEATFQSISKEIVRLYQEVVAVRQENKNIIIGAVVAVILIVASVAVEVIIFHTRTEISSERSTHINNIEKDILNNRIEMQKEIINLQKNNTIGTVKK